VLDFELLKSQFSSSGATSTETQPNDRHPSKEMVQLKGTKKREASPIQERPGKIVKGPLKNFGLTQIVESGDS
jgi:hypothetical protein